MQVVWSGLQLLSISRANGTPSYHLLPSPNPDTRLTHYDVKHAHSQKRARKMPSAYRKGKKERRAAPLVTSPIPSLILDRAGGRGLSLCGLGGNKTHCLNMLQLPYKISQIGWLKQQIFIYFLTVPEARSSGSRLWRGRFLVRPSSWLAEGHLPLCAHAASPL